VQNRQLQTCLGADDYAQLEAEWQEQLGVWFLQQSAHDMDLFYQFALLATYGCYFLITFVYRTTHSFNNSSWDTRRPKYSSPLAER
jgi:hypothetical protein